MGCQTFFPGHKLYMGKIFISAMLWPGSRVRSSNQPSLGLGTALYMYERQSRAGCEVRRSMSCSKRWEQGEQNEVTLSKPEGWDVIIVGARWRSQEERAKKKVTGLEAKCETTVNS